MSNNDKEKSFWSTLPGILTGIAAIISAIGGLILALNTANIISIPPDTPTPSPTITTPSPTITAPIPTPTIFITGSVMWGSVPVIGGIVELKEAGNYYTMPVLSQAEVGADGKFKVGYTQAGSYMIYAVSPSDEYWTWSGKSITLLADQTIDAGTLSLEKKLKLLEPANLATVSTATPTLRWMSFPDATRYHVDVFNDQTNQAVLRQDTTDNSLIIAQPLASGVRYEWSVHAYNTANIEIAYYSSWHFTVQT